MCARRVNHITGNLQKDVIMAAQTFVLTENVMMIVDTVPDVLLEHMGYSVDRIVICARVVCVTYENAH